METYISIKKCKKIKSVLLIVLMILLSYPSFSQSLFEKTGGIKTEFRILSDTVELTILAQGLIERGFFETNTEKKENYSYGWGYGLQVWYLEFVTNVNLTWVEQPRESALRFGWSYCEIILLDESNTPLMISKIPTDYFKKVSNKNGVFTYAFNISEVPLILLDKTLTIKIKKTSIF